MTGIAGGPAGRTFSLVELQNKFDTGGLTTSQLVSLKGMAKSSGYYANPVSGNLVIQQDDVPSHSGNVVVYVEFSGGTPAANEVSLKFEWPHSPYTTGQAMVVIKNGSVKMTGNAIGHFNGSVYCPDGEVRVDGSGGGEFTGFLWAKGLTDIGNFNFKMTPEFIADPPFFTWTVLRQAEWTEVDG